MTRTGELTAKQSQAAVLVAEDRLTDPKIARKVGISLRTIYKWKADPTFAQRVSAHRIAFEQQELQRGIAAKVRRVQALNAGFDAIEQIRRERASRYGKDVAGGRTGFVVLEPMLVKVYGELDEKGRFIPTGQSELVQVEKVDNALYRDRLKTLEQMAREKGEWVEKSETKADVHLLDADTALDRKLDSLAAELAAPVPGEPDAE